MKGSFRVAAQTSRWARFAAVEVEVVPAVDDHVAIAHNTIDETIQYEAKLGALRALRILPGNNHITVTEIRTSPVDTSTGDVFEATARAVWNAYGMPDHDASLREHPLIERRLIELHGRALLGVTESRYWFGGVRDGDAESLVSPWFHFEHAPPIQLRVHGEDLSLAYEVPYSSCDMEEYGELRVSTAQQPDLLATPIGQHLQSSTVFASPWTSDGYAGAILLEFSASRVLIGASADEWVLINNPSSDYLATGWTSRD